VRAVRLGVAVALAAVLLAAGRGWAATAPQHTNVSMFFPAWSRGGDLIAWTQPGANGGARLWVAHPDGSRAHPIVPSVRGLGQIAWVGGDRLLVWVGFRLTVVTLAGHGTVVARVNGERFSLDARGDRVATVPPRCSICGGPVEVQNLVTGRTVDIGPPDGRAAAPSLSPDGGSVAFQRTRCDRSGDACSPLGGIWVASTRTSTGHPRELTRRGTCPAWGPGGRAVAYLLDGRLRLADVASARTVLLDPDATCGQTTAPAWSPDGKRLAVVDHAQRLALVDVAARRVRVVPNPGIGVVIGLSWSPNGRELLVAARPVPLACSSLWRIDAATGQARLVRAC
jgi:WD40-like Beta Propeller Repeat